LTIKIICVIIPKLNSFKGIILEKVKDLVELLKPYGENLTVQSFNNKMTRKGFSAEFFLKCMFALGVKDIKIKD
jgi:hypothetical protein